LRTGADGFHARGACFRRVSQGEPKSVYLWRGCGFIRERKKERSGNYNYSASPYTSDGWSARGDEWVYIRGRSQTGAQATQSAHINYTGRQKDGSLTYLSGYGALNGYYRVAIEYDNNNPYQYVYLAVSWNP